MRELRNFQLTALLLVLALALGGAGSTYPLIEMLIEIVSIAVLAWAALQLRPDRLTAEAKFALTVLALILLLPLLQLIPLPPGLWRALPGRELAARIADLTGLSGAWQPLSLAPEATRRSLLSLLPGAAMFVAALNLPTPLRLRLAWIVVGFAVFGVLLGALQLASGDGSGVTPFPSSHLGSAVGLFVNRNHQANFLLVSIPITAAAGSSWASRARDRQGPLLLTIGVIGLLALGVIVTTSRMGTALLPLALIGAGVIIGRGRLGSRGAAALAAVGVMMALLALQSAVIGRTLLRFETIDDARFDYWQNTLWAIGQFGLAGTGIGSFVPIYQSAEPLDALTPLIINHAHNDFLELVLEGGIPGVAILGLFLLAVALSARRLFSKRVSPERGALGIAALFGLALILLHSVVDYPLRMAAIETMLALLCALLMPPQRDVNKSGVGGAAQSNGRAALHRSAGAALIAIAALLTWQALAAGVSARAIQGENTTRALAWAPWSDQARLRLATSLLLEGKQGPALEAARAAIAHSPMQAAAVRTVGMVAGRAGERRRAFDLMTAAGALGWRDPATQLWIIDEALRQQEAGVAMQRVDALLRQGVMTDQLFAILPDLAEDPIAGNALALQLATDPPWRRKFLTVAASSERHQLGALTQLLLRMKATSMPPDVVETRPLFKQLAAAGAYVRAHHLWTTLIAGGALYDPGFEKGRHELSDGGPFEWRAKSLPGTNVSVEMPDEPLHGAALRMFSDGESTGPVLRQTVVLEPGTYTLSFWHRPIGSRLVPQPEWSIVCPESGTTLLVATPEAQPLAGDWTIITARFTVPKSACDVQLLRLQVSLGKAFSSWIDDIEIRPIRD